jgi:hypothetical protein
VNAFVDLFAAVDREDRGDPVGVVGVGVLAGAEIHYKHTLSISTMARFAQLGIMLLAARACSAFAPVSKTYGTRAIATSSVLKASDSDFDDYKAEVCKTAHLIVCLSHVPSVSHA